MADDLAALRAAIDKLPDAVTAQLRAIAWRYAREAKDLARSILLSKAHGHNTAGHQHTADSFVIHEEADKKQFRVAVENPDQPNLALWIERGTRFIGATALRAASERPALSEVFPRDGRSGRRRGREDAGGALMDIRVRWADNTRELAANLKSGADQIEVTKAAAEKMAQSLQGDKLIQAAANMAAAIQQVGGTTTLTASQMERANALFEKAAEKLQLTGQGGTYAAQTFRELAEQTKGASEETTNWLTIMRDVGTSWVARIAEGVLLRDAIRDVIGKVKELAAALPEIALKGAAVADVEENFNRLTAQAGRLGSTLMGALKDGTHNTIDNFQLMKTATQDLAAGMNLTDQQFSTLAKGAFALAQATGTDVKTALDTMNDAMLTGRTRALALLTGKIDLSAAEEAYAKKLGTTVDHLTDAGKLEAARVGILDSVTAATKRLGDQTDGLDERVAQAGAAWENFKDDLGKTIATSDVLATGLTELKRSLEQTFGGSQDALIAAIAAEIDDVAIASVKAAELVVEAGGLIVKEWSAAKVVFGDVAQVIDGVRLAYLMTRQAMTLGLLPGHVDLREWQQLDKQIGDLELSMVKRGQALQADKAAEESADAATAKYVATLDQLRQHMEEARQRSLALAQQATATATATNTASAAAENHAALLKRSASEIAKDKTAYEEWQKAVKNLTDQFDGMDWDYTIDGALKLGGSVNDISKYFGLSEGEVNRHKEALKVWAAVAKLEAAGAARGLSSELEHLGTVIPGSQFAASAKIFGNITEMNAKPAQIPPGLENLGQKIKPAMDDVAKTVTTTFDNSFRKLPDLLIASFTGNGNFWGGLKALGTDITKGLFGGVAGSKDAGPFAGFTKGLADAVTSATSFLGKSISGILGSTISGFLPGIGSLIGPAISGVISFIKNIGGPSKEELSARDQQNELVKQLTSNLTETYATFAIVGRDAMLKIGKSAAEADQVVQGLLDTHNPQRFAAAMKQVQDAHQPRDQSADRPERCARSVSLHDRAARASPPRAEARRAGAAAVSGLDGAELGADRHGRHRRSDVRERESVPADRVEDRDGNPDRYEADARADGQDGRSDRCRWEQADRGRRRRDELRDDDDAGLQGHREVRQGTDRCHCARAGCRDR
jgi:hypothetical protein